MDLFRIKRKKLFRPNLLAARLDECPRLSLPCVESGAQILTTKCMRFEWSSEYAVGVSSSNLADVQFVPQSSPSEVRLELVKKKALFGLVFSSVSDGTISPGWGC